MKTLSGKPVIVSVRNGKLRLRAVAVRAGDDLAVTLTGGDRPHIGCAVLAQPHPAANDSARASVTSSVLVIPPHREEVLARPLAEKLAKACHATVVVAAGIHTDGLTSAGIATYLVMRDQLVERLIQALCPGRLYKPGARREQRRSQR